MNLNHPLIVLFDEVAISRVKIFTPKKPFSLAYGQTGPDLNSQTNGKCLKRCGSFVAENS